MGVRISWLMLARNSLLARLAASAASFAVRSSSSGRLRSVMSWMISMVDIDFSAAFPWRLGPGLRPGQFVPSLRWRRDSILIWRILPAMSA